MKKTTLLNAPLSHAIASLGHTDGLTICDAGLPIPSTQHAVDLALTAGIPAFCDTLNVVLSELYVERVLLAEEIRQINPCIHQQIVDILRQVQQEQGNEIRLDYVPHSEFKAHSNRSKAVVRSGECSPYANIILYSGVPF